MYQQVVRQQIGVDLLQRFDPFALSPLSGDRASYYFLKRVLDLTLAALALVILSPLLVFIALLILVDSGWPIIFSQERVGAQRWSRDGYGYWQRTPFTCYKFRSMVQDADPSLHCTFVKALIHNDQQCLAELQGGDTATHKLVNDPRVTRIGRYLRMTSLDELPQLWNVLKGTMSLVGPRPDVPYSVEEYNSWHQQRLAAQPGISGLWQVKGRSEIDFDDMVRMDIEYIDNQSLFLDLEILLLTIPAVLTGHGAV